MIGLTKANRIENGVLTEPVHILVSPFKTGTSSVAKALKMLGVGRKIMRYDQPLQKRNLTAMRAANKLAREADDFAAFQTQHGPEMKETFADLVKAIAPYDIFHDAPFGHTHLHPFVRKVLAPKARLIWVNRDFDDWIASVSNWETSHPKIYPNHDRWTTDPEGQAEMRRKFLRKHRKQFRRLKRALPEDCLVMKWSDLNDFSALAAFYDVPVPEKPFPQVNISILRAT